MMSSGLLQNKGVVVTRPREQAGDLVEALKAVAARPILFPAVQIEAPENWQSLDDALHQLDTFDWVIFTSRNAVAFALSRLQSRNLIWPQGPRVAAVGRETAKALREFGLQVDLVPKKFSSEGLLNSAELAEMQDRHVALFVGDQGRELLEKVLRERGAQVNKVLCYRRTLPGANPTPLLHAWARGELDAVTLTSPEIFNNFYQMIGGLGQRWLKNTPLIAISPLTAEAITAVGLPDPWVAEEASTEGIMAALEVWAKSREQVADV
ncbi:uroporphyrinogen-III synthase [Acidithiobacillus thiooxidans]|uniref:Uroporphyrinogen-III synthase n=1 Tax=Acidithiobacillus thiooxidans ATCC 19377 TaxID=637390 RepID=A0A543Q6W2_ACITH|nr:uroporphyrinogen-III synthase [Acidithiobacillus thiooxidans]MDR7928555.1 uroporphyrinogen-III synthase [Acidithiobacillus thiooxidans]MDX5933731.1 uroporphyrinogen-III synthase [Acidithiobacillus thiooxidans]TQN52052.1 Uroporphyrinogen-III synthase [Acidithiobacillus thiooxidans ATCC 19377]